MTRAGYVLLGLTAIVGSLAGILSFAVMNIFAAARKAAKGGTPVRGEAVFMASAMEDALQAVKAQELAMKARAEASERLSSEIIASMTSGLLVVSEGGHVRTLNPAGRRLLGIAEDADVSASYKDVLASAAPLSDVVGEGLTVMRPIVRRAVQMAQPAGGATHLGITVSPVRDGAGEPHGAICLFTDLSEVADLEEQLRLKDSLARLGELTAGIAHEFRNGLATIHGYARLLALDQLQPDFRPYVQGIRDETEALGQVVTNFLNFAKPTDLTLTPVEMQGIVERAAEEIRPDARTRGGDVTVTGRIRPGRRGRSPAPAGLQQLVPQCARGMHGRERPAPNRDRRRGRAGPQRSPDYDQPTTGRASSRSGRRKSSRPSSPRRREAPGSGSPWCRRSSSPTTGGSPLPMPAAAAPA